MTMDVWVLGGVNRWDFRGLTVDRMTPEKRVRANDICLARSRQTGLWVWMEGDRREDEISIYLETGLEFDAMLENLRRWLKLYAIGPDAQHCARAIEGLSYRDGELQA